jgi:hypothetical protein
MISRIAVILGLCSSLSVAESAQAPNWLNCVVAVCRLRSRVSQGKLVADTTVLGTATLVTDGKFAFAATARHVVRGMDSVYLRFPLVGGGHALAKIGGSVPYNFIFPEDALLDLSLSVVQWPEGASTKGFTPSLFARPFDLTPGRELKVVGFPVSISVPDDFPFVRYGMVSAAPDSSGYYYIDSNVFPGNSGGAVLITPEADYSMVDALMPHAKDSLAREAMGYYANTRLAGIVVGYLPYRVTARDQTGRPRIEFEENSGITLVVTPQALLRFMQNRK